MLQSGWKAHCTWVQGPDGSPVKDLCRAGVILTRSREPYRAIDTLRQFAFAEKMDFRVWTILRGWETYNRANPEQPPAADNVAEPNMAIKAIGADAQAGFSVGVHVMFYPHPYLRIAPFVQQIKEYARVFPETKKRLVLLCPPGVTLPPELEDDITVLDFDTPSYSELTTTYREILEGIPTEKRPRLDAEGMERLLSAGIGLTAHEAETALSRALVVNRTKLPRVTADDLASVIMDVKIEAVKKSETLEIMPPESMGNVGGLENLKDWVSKRRHAYTDEARAFGIEAPKGIVLAGPPGTGKTLCGKAIASEMGLPLLKVDISRMFGGIVGETETKVRNTLKLIDSMAPCVALFDEVGQQVGVRQ